MRTNANQHFSKIYHSLLQKYYESPTLNQFTEVVLQHIKHKKAPFDTDSINRYINYLKPLADIGKWEVIKSRKQSKSANHHSVMLKLSANSTLQVIVVGHKPETYSNNFIFTSGMEKSYKVGKLIELETQTTQDILIEILNRSSNSRAQKNRVQLTKAMVDKAESEPLTTIHYRNATAQDKQPTWVAYRFHQKSHVKFDLLTVLQYSKVNDQTAYLSYDILFSLLQQITFEQMKFYQKNKRPHGDIKLENMLVNADGELSIIDPADRVTIDRGLYCSTPVYIPPESKQHLLDSADTFAKGLMLIPVISSILLRYPHLNEYQRKALDHLSGGFNQHNDLMASVFTESMNHRPKAQEYDLGKNRDLQREYLKFCRQDLTNIPSFLKLDEQMTALIDLINQMISADPRQRPSLENTVACLSRIKSEQRSSSPQSSESCDTERYSPSSATLGSQSLGIFKSKKQTKKKKQHHAIPTISSKLKVRRKFQKQETPYRKCSLG